MADEINVHVFDVEISEFEDLKQEQIDYRDRTISALFGIKIVAPVCLGFVMFALGCNLHFGDARKNLKLKKKQVSAVVGAMCQFALMPLLGFACIYMFGLHRYMYVAGGAILLACSPGVLVSIYFTRIVRADFVLSVSMTAIFSALSVGLTPLCIFIYGQAWANRLYFIHYGYVAVLIAVMLVPLLFGAILRSFVGEKLETVSKFVFPLTVILSIAYLVITIISDPSLLFSDWRPWVFAWFYSLVALIIGYLAGFVACLSHPECRTVAYETACQNVPVAVSIIAMTIFVRDGIILQMLIIPVLYELFMYINSLLFFGLYRCCMSVRLPKSEDTKRIVRTPSTAGSISTVNTGVTSGSITTVLPPGSYVNYALDLNNSYNKSFAPVVRFDPDTQDIGNKYGHQTVQTPQADDGGFGEREEKVIIPRKYRGRTNPEREGVELEAASPQKKKSDAVDGDATPVKKGDKNKKDGYPKPIDESTPARPPLPKENLYTPRQPSGYANYALDGPEESRPVQSPRPRYEEKVPERPPLPKDYTPEPQYAIPDQETPKQTVVLDPRRDIHSSDYRDRAPPRGQGRNPGRGRNPDHVSGYYGGARRSTPRANGEVSSEFESEV
ncbi:hepatic sodium/bile acid cotransporter-like [Ptychodera flava]|uniref:hepatic sodium/bile acid cotransporter-like n=1 Tax=Ptychodera flava TaxID=63121 RepID=UPI00396A435C